MDFRIVVRKFLKTQIYLERIEPRPPRPVDTKVVNQQFIEFLIFRSDIEEFIAKEKKMQNYDVVEVFSNSPLIPDHLKVGCTGSFPLITAMGD